MKFTFVRKLYFFLFFIPCIKERIKKVEEFWLKRKKIVIEKEMSHPTYLGSAICWTQVCWFWHFTKLMFYWVWLIAEPNYFKFDMSLDSPYYRLSQILKNTLKQLSCHTKSKYVSSNISQDPSPSGWGTIILKAR